MQIGGLVSGLDTTALVDQLVTLERRPIVTLGNRASLWQKQKDAWRDINTRLDNLNKKIKDLQDIKVFQAQETTSSDEKVVTASSSGGTIGGTYNITINNLATSTKLTSGNSMSNPVDAAVSVNSAGFSITPSSGTFSINGVVINLDASTESLNDIIAKINASAAGVTASFDSLQDKITFTSGAAIQLGSAADTSNFLTATKVISETGGADPTTVTSGSKLGATLLTANLQDARFSNTFSAPTGTFAINGVEFTYDIATESLDSIIKKINESQANVTMSYDSINDKLIMQSKNTGSIDISLNDVSGNFLDVVQLSTGTKDLGKNASYTLNGNLLNSTSNSVADVVPGLTFELKSDGGSATVTVKQDPNSTFDKIKGFVEQYNTVQDFINTKLAKGADLQGDTGLMRVQSNLRTKVGGLVQGLNTEFKILADIGIESDKTGILTINEGKLKDAIKEKGFSVYSLFNDPDGIGTRLKTEIDNLTESGTGIISGKQQSYDRLIKDVNDRIKVMEERLERKRESMLRQFTAMEKAMSRFSNQGAWLDSQLKQLGGWNTNNG